MATATQPGSKAAEPLVRVVKSERKGETVLVTITAQLFEDLTTMDARKVAADAAAKLLPGSLLERESPPYPSTAAGELSQHAATNKGADYFSRCLRFRSRL